MVSKVLLEMDSHRRRTQVQDPDVTLMLIPWLAATRRCSTRKRIFLSLTAECSFLQTTNTFTADLYDVNDSGGGIAKCVEGAMNANKL